MRPKQTRKAIRFYQNNATTQNPNLGDSITIESNAQNDQKMCACLEVIISVLLYLCCVFFLSVSALFFIIIKAFPAIFRRKKLSFTNQSVIFALL